MNVDHVDLPINMERRSLVLQDPNVEDISKTIWIMFNPEEQIEYAGKGATRAKIGTTSKLQISFVNYLNEYDLVKLE